MFLTLLRFQHPLVYRFAWLRLRVVVLRTCGMRKRKGGVFYSAVAVECGACALSGLQMCVKRRPDKRSAIRHKCQALHAEVAWWDQRRKGVELLHHLFPEQHNNNPLFEISALF